MELKKTQVGVVSYRNTAPLVYGMQEPAFAATHNIISDYPARIAAALQQGEVDVALVPVAVLATLPQYYIVSNYCIGADGDVASVALFSEVPVAQLEAVYLDYQSRSSVALFRILMQHLWKINPRLLQAEDDSYRTRISGTTGAVVIGDRALEQRHQSSYVYDLAGAWKQLTDLPFVFAVWVSLKPMPDAWQRQFDAAQAVGLGKLQEIAQAQNYAPFDLHKYYTQYLQYKLTNHMRSGINRFLEYLQHAEE